MPLPLALLKTYAAASRYHIIAYHSMAGWIEWLEGLDHSLEGGCLLFKFNILYIIYLDIEKLIIYIKISARLS